jgi:hypothetical protein
VDRLSDFLDGEYHIPLQFVGNIRIGSPGTYFARAYSLIDGKNYWSDEQSFIVKEIPRNKISMIGYPQKVKTGENASFTWEITGPQTTTGYTVIVGGKQSKSGNLDESVELSLTPYSVLVKEFIGGSYNVPLRFVGNTVFTETGTYYLRAFSSINNKNIWSEEFSMNVE